MRKLLLGCLLIAGSASAQIPNLDLQADPKLHTVNPAFSKESAVILSDKRLHHYVKDDKRGIIVYLSNRKLIKVNDDKGVELFNKIYIPLGVGTEVVDVKARTIQPDGRVINVPPTKMLEVEEEGRRYKKFALEGVEKGSEIEYYYKIKKDIYFFGLEMFQTSYAPYQEAQFTLVSPQHLVFSIKGYNGFNVGKETVMNEERIITATGKDIPTLEEEKYGAKEPYSMNVQYKLSYNIAKDKEVKLFTWNDLAKNVYGNLTDATDKERKAVDNFVKQAKIDESASDEQKIILIEDYIKNSINSDENGIGEDADKIEKIVKNKVASNDGLYKLFAMSLDKLNINWQAVFPSKRDELPLDEELENFRLVEDMVFYFPATGEFLEPTNSSLRYPYIQPHYAATRGLFLKGTTIGTFRTAFPAFGDISIQPYEKSGTDMEVRLKFNEALDSIEIHSKQILSGYGATSYRPAYAFLPKDKIDDFNRDVIKSVAKGENIRNIKVQNTAMTDAFLNKPLIIEADITTADLLEVAGKKLLVRVGEVIGPQAELYQEKPRQLPILIQFPHKLDRDISFVIPAGYKITNLADLNMNVTGKGKNKETMGFISTYTIDGDVLNVKVHEYYKETSYPLNEYNEYKDVVNAAADFNKIVLIFEKK